jgi:hypothetical protein
MSMSLSSEAFADGARIPRKHTGDGEDRSPPLRWDGLPDGAVELALICDDPDAPSPQPWVHWVLYGIPASASGLPAGLPPGTRLAEPVAAMQGRNSWSGGRTTGYRGPAPPPRHGLHHYHFRLYALDARLDLKPGVDKPALLAAIKGHVLAEAVLTGTYERP